MRSCGAGSTICTTSSMSQDVNKQQLLSSCEACFSYPCNLIRSLIFEHALESYRHKLHEESERLFNPFPRTKLLRFWETNSACSEFKEYTPIDFGSLKKHCQGNDSQDPACRYIFLQSKNARARLEFTQEDFNYILSYHQVMPPFLDLVFTCGRQEKLQDFHYTAFRHENYLHRGDPLLQDMSKITPLGRSGRQIQHCYNLHSAERSRDKWGWSIRQTVVFHSFDVDTGRSVWIFVKGNDIIENRIKTATSSTRSTSMDVNSHRTLTGSFDASLIVHAHIMEWCGEQWRWYINEMEDRLRNKAKNAVLANVDHLAGPEMVPAPSRPGTLILPSSPRRTVSKSSPASSPTRLWNSFTKRSIGSKTEKTLPVVETDPSRPIHADIIVEEPQEIDYGGNEESIERMFSFEKLQDLHKTGEYMQEALMVLRQNRNIIKEIREHYSTLLESDDFPAEIKDGCRLGMPEFSQRALSIERDLEVQQSRLETLNVLLEDRSNLFYGVQQYASMQASKHFATNAQASTEFTTAMTARMHIMTEKMHEIALKTGHQTVSMHVITVFTLLFLPGTFLATFFSSGILRWYDEEDELANSTYSWATEHDRLLLYLEILVPMTVLIIVGWLILYLKSRDKDSEEEDELRTSLDLEKGPENPQ
ncbi:uncharacterized protein F4807DRAFT_414287 [Annulohypoxylon truncatum]|uniref:uncharacterized protein n=1 Tax=Annulohypoxylon truncatum TaxID=327061 RepID=UPI002007CA38|nr:uncharacterized protein F4807DRAFT_414287 [Annulohypoxylon truncatum]KAI1212738.1 hypothetical protein F4807DRAFT_414287 [Annulohypoxylon truncatum]